MFITVKIVIFFQLFVFCAFIIDGYYCGRLYKKTNPMNNKTINPINNKIKSIISIIDYYVLNYYMKER